MLEVEDTLVGGESGGGTELAAAAGTDIAAGLGGGGGGGGMAEASLMLLLLELEHEPTRVAGSTGTLGRLTKG